MCIRDRHKVEATKSARVSGEKGDRGFIGHKAAKMMQRSKNVERRINRAIEEKSGLLKNVEIVEKLKIAPLVLSLIHIWYQHKKLLHSSPLEQLLAKLSDKLN